MESAHDNALQELRLHITATSKVLVEAMAIIHDLAPMRFESALRTSRLLAQAAQMGTLDLADPRALRVQRFALEILEEAREIAAQRRKSGDATG